MSPAALLETSEPPWVATPLLPQPKLTGVPTVAPLQLMVSTPTPTVIPTLLPTPENTALSLWILYTSDTRGYVSPCG